LSNGFSLVESLSGGSSPAEINSFLFACGDQNRADFARDGVTVRAPVDNPILAPILPPLKKVGKKAWQALRFLANLRAT
jgi:hypothetical protein